MRRRGRSGARPGRAGPRAADGAARRLLRQFVANNGRAASGSVVVARPAW
ncbi:hypothetical protein KCH_54360 [Kitasatospora cheerisanensis KCTC 2395]|uniref:Uncharacterized protein n=1 Tax=Kitasatospora cheerisanensis KCTC 2395 TaxID=1348663 RepID=A0A066YNP7_9ACTN|nr:hypothetical protein KCH_54360 [Kitasatospora cheerisanensis KCTC 2395]